jgi:pimeloyl-ACP methyl ester carboxylesterase
MTGRGILGAVLLVVALAAGGCGGKAGGGGASPTPSPVKPIADCVSQDEQRAGGLRLDTEGGKHADALIVGTGGTGIVFANQSGETVCSWKPWADLMAQKGFRALVFEYSGDYADKDVLAGIDALRKKGVQKVLLVGASMGGTAVLGAAAKAQPPVAGVVSLLDDRIGKMVEDFLKNH